MSRTRAALTLGIALVTILGFTAAIAAPTGAAFTTSDDSSLAGFGDGFSFMPSESGDEPPACEKGNGSQDENNPNCDEGDEEEDDEEEDDENENGGEEPGDAGTCEEGGAAQNNTVANEAFGTENESGPISSQVHANEEQFQDGEPIAHEVSCGVATIDNNAPGGDDNESDDGGDQDPQEQFEEVVDELENASDGGDQDPQEQFEELVGELENASNGSDEDPQEQFEELIGELENASDGGGDDEPTGDGTCAEGGVAQNNTVANEAFGTENESGPISSQVHANEEQFQDGEPIAHEVSCGVATIDNNAPE